MTIEYGQTLAAVRGLNMTALAIARMAKGMPIRSGPSRVNTRPAVAERRTPTRATPYPNAFVDRGEMRSCSDIQPIRVRARLMHREEIDQKYAPFPRSRPVSNPLQAIHTPGRISQDEMSARR
ncbi:hypothetical protein [Microbacterium oleivorans]|uniref:hypothetical protein n=1 Tax=Microbacterium oleivorans TaxID=273677 RepID=UPI00080DD6F7|nr:hypothetical protein [Microbacterium oleivorans]